MNLKLNKIFFYLFFTLWCLLIVTNAFKKQTDFSENENRNLSGFPSFSLSSFLDGTFMQKVDEHFNDQFILRDRWISAQSVSEYAIGKRENNGIFIGKDVLIQKPAKPIQKNVDSNIDGVLSFTKKYNLPSYFMLVPSAASIQSAKLPSYAFNTTETLLINTTRLKLQEICFVDVESALAEHSGEYIYYRTDHHWTTYGAYLAYESFCALKGMLPLKYSVTDVSTDFNGTLYSRSGVRFIESDIISSFNTPYDGGIEMVENDKVEVRDSVYFPEYLEKKDKYAYFLGTNKAFVTIHGTASTGKKLLMFKDSYSHCLAPMLLSMYDEITLVDLRYINSKIENFIDPKSYDEVLYLYSVDTFTQQNILVKLGL